MTVPNVSEGRDLATLEAIGRAFAPARFLDLHADPDHDRAVFTLAARQGEMAEALLNGARSAVARIDIIAHTDPLGTSSPRIKVQVKRQADTKIGREGISSFVGTLGSNDVGIYVSAGGFTNEAEREARSQEQRRLTLIDLGRLVELWIEHSPKLDYADRRRLPLKPIYFLSPSE